VPIPKIIGTSFLKEKQQGFKHLALKINPSFNSTKVEEDSCLSELSGYRVISSSESRFLIPASSSVLLFLSN